MAVAPVQPMSVTAQANLRGMRDEVLSWNPDFPPWMADKSINNGLRNIIDRRMWSGLLVKSQLLIPAEFTTGTVAVTRESATVTGTATAWATNDGVSTTLSEAITDTDILIDVTPVSMAGIAVGDWLTLGGGTGSEEQVLVSSKTATSFRTKCTLTHLAGVTVWRSSLVRRQFKINETAPWYSVKGVSSGTQLILDDVWGGATLSGQSYSIFLAYCVFGDDCKMVMEMANLNRRYRVGLHMPQASINAYDPQRSATESTYLLIDLSPDEVGRPRYEMYPRPTSEQVFALMYYRVTGNLEDDEDTAPPFIPSDLLVTFAITDALRFRPKMNRFYDPGTALSIANTKRAEYEQRFMYMVQADDAVYMQNLTWKYSQWPLGSYGADWLQSHDVGIMNGDI